MIFWLDLNSNRKSKPNENFARELMELFSLGVGTPSDPNYSEEDIKQATKAFTGYTVGTDGNFTLNQSQHDTSTKTVLGKPCESGDQVIEILMRHTKKGRNVCARFMAAKLLTFFAFPVGPDSAVVGPFADTFVGSGFSVRALVEAILKSPEFSSNAAYRALIKSPVELAVGALRTLGAERIPSWGVLNALEAQGQRLFYPPDVAGWPGGRSWINASTVLSRCNMIASIVGSLGRTRLDHAGGVPVATLVERLTTGSAKVDRLLDLLVDGNIPTAARDSLIAYAETSITEERLRGLLNLVMALPAYHLN
jgi:uncharacterized protein (DUF1800 family)